MSEFERSDQESTPVSQSLATKAFAGSGVEPLLEDLMHDPTTRAVMASDRVRYRDLRNLVTTARLSLRGLEGVSRIVARV